jgi:hypothetical protein
MTRIEAYHQSVNRLRGPDYSPAVSFRETHDSSNLTFGGSAEVDGQGYWCGCATMPCSTMETSFTCYEWSAVATFISQVSLVNFPMYHLFFVIIDNFYIADFEIFEQKKLA